MKYTTSPFDQIPQLSSRDKAYQANDSRLRAFYPYSFEQESFEQIIADRRKFPVDRSLLVDQLQQDYQNRERSAKLSSNITALEDEKNFCVITAHQPVLLGGPLYYIIKICSCINLARQLSNDTRTIVPVFVLGAEDHDFDESNHLQLFGKTIRWDRKSQGAIGRLNLDGLDELLEETYSILGDSIHATDLKTKIQKAFKESSSYGEFMFAFTHALFDEYGLVIVNMDRKSYKHAFKTIIEKEIFHEMSKPYIKSTQAKLEELGFKQQAYAREINFFYLHDGNRNRIERHDNRYKVVDTTLEFSKTELKKELDTHPERFSPNVIMRPLYQECILPNLAYIGGGGELAYWMERRSQFEAFELFYPMLVRRNSVLWLSKKHQKSMDKLNIEVHDLFKQREQLLKEFALKNSQHSTDLGPTKIEITESYQKITTQLEAIDKTLVPKLEAMRSNHIQAIEKLEQRLVRTVKQQQETQLNQLKKLQDQLFPNQGLQERKTNFMEIYLQHGNKMFDYLIEICNPFDKEFIIVKAD